MSHSKVGTKRKKPSHMRYNSEHHRYRNKLRRVMKFCGVDFAEKWEKQYG